MKDFIYKGYHVFYFQSERLSCNYQIWKLGLTEKFIGLAFTEEAAKNRIDDRIKQVKQKMKEMYPNGF